MNAGNNTPQHRAMLARPTRIPAPASWAAADQPREPQDMAVVVDLADGKRVAYTRPYVSSMAAVDEALCVYGDRVRRINVRATP